MIGSQNRFSKQLLKISQTTNLLSYLGNVYAYAPDIWPSVSSISLAAMN